MDVNIPGKCTELKLYWNRRNRKMEDWYDLLELKDNLEQEGLESYISNEPRTYYNFACYLLSDAKIIHNIPNDSLTMYQADTASEIEKRITFEWKKLDNKFKKAGRNDFQTLLVSYLLAFGWYSVFVLYTADKGFIAEPYHPATVFPEFGDEGLLRVAHLYTMTAAQANSKARVKGWPLKKEFTAETTLYDYWELRDGEAWNGINMGNEDIVPFSATGLPEIPYLISPTGGLPDRGELGGRYGNLWQDHCGESILAVNEKLYTQFNKYMSLTQEWLRNTAQPHWIEKSTGGDIITREGMMQRGGIFRASPNDDIEPLIPPTIPADLKMQMYEIQNQIQRGALPYSLYGNISTEISGYLLSQIATGAKQNLQPYMDAVQMVFSNIDNYLYRQLLQVGEIESDLPEDIEFEDTIRVDIPSDIVQRASACKALSPTFRLSNTTIMDTLFPEISNPQEEIRNIKSEDAMSSPEVNELNLVSTLRNQADYLERRGLVRQADLYRKMIETIEARIVPQEPTPPGPIEGRGEVPVPRVPRSSKY